jgi:hypothetical protein
MSGSRSFGRRAQISNWTLVQCQQPKGSVFEWPIPPIDIPSGHWRLRRQILRLVRVDLTGAGDSGRLPRGTEADDADRVGFVLALELVGPVHDGGVEARAVAPEEGPGVLVSDWAFIAGQVFVEVDCLKRSIRAA